MRLTFVLLFCVSFAFSQTNDSQLAYQYYQSAEYEKAIEIYENLSKGSNFSQYYSPYLQCLVLSDNLPESKKLVQRMIRKNSHSLTMHVDLYMVYVKLEEEKNAQKTILNQTPRLDAHLVDRHNRADETLLHPIHFPFRTIQPLRRLAGISRTRRTGARGECQASDANWAR